MWYARAPEKPDTVFPANLEPNSAPQIHFTVLNPLSETWRVSILSQTKETLNSKSAMDANFEDQSKLPELKLGKPRKCKNKKP